MKGFASLLFSFFFLVFFQQTSLAQVTCSPAFPNTDSDITITFHADQGNAALAGFAGNVYMHAGVITNLSTSPSDWKHVQTTWGTADPKGLMTKTGPNTYTRAYNIRTYYGVPTNETVEKLAFVFRDQAGNTVGRASDGGDIYYDVVSSSSPLTSFFQTPTDAVLIVGMGETIPVSAKASQAGALKLFDNGQLIATQGNATTLTAQITVSQPGTHEVIFVVTTPITSDTSSFIYVVKEDLTPMAAPVGMELGVNYIDNQTVLLLLEAPEKNTVFLQGDFNNWVPTIQMRPTPDGNRYWTRLSNLTAGTEYGYQYIVDGQAIADPLATKILDPWNDPSIPSVTYPNLKAYPTGKASQWVSVFQPGQTAYQWQVTNFDKPNPKELVVYELLMRDFLARHDYQTLLDTLDYLENLGITAIEFMPLQEFDGNESWGYNPAYHNALDKYYGTPAAFKKVVDECHKRGIAVIVDVVFNHVSGANPIASMYWDGPNNRPAANSPYLNATAKHDFNVFNDMNHESVFTKNYVERCLKYWLKEYHIDGYRFDLSKGFTQKNTLGSTSAWGNYDASRITILKNYVDVMHSVDPNAYAIMEHFADNTEETVLADYGMMLWNNMHYAFKEVGNGYPGGLSQSFYGVSHISRNWSVPHLMSYMESHDEERVMYEMETYGSNNSNGYNIKELPIALARMEALSNLFYAVPGPKMLWQFGEQGYGFSINTCPNGTISPDCRVANKPIRWDYLNNADRLHLHDMTSALLHLRKTEPVFQTDDVSLFISTGTLRYVVLKSPTVNAVVVSNVGVVQGSTTLPLPHSGTWYEYYSGQSFTTTSASTNLTLKQGDYRIFIDKYVPLPVGVNLTSPVQNLLPAVTALAVYPNPASTEIQVEFDMESTQNLHFSLLDIAGKTVQNWGENTYSSGRNGKTLPLSGLASGLYFLEIRNALGQKTIRKVVVK